MALADSVFVQWPHPPGWVQSAVAVAISAADAGFAAMFPAPKAGTIRYVEFYCSFASSPVLTLTGGLQGVASSIPDGTFTHSTTLTSFTAGQWISFDLGAGAGKVVAAGEVVCAAVSCTAYTSGNIQAVYTASADNQAISAWTATQSGGAWTKVSVGSGVLPCLRIRYDDGSGVAVPYLAPIGTTSNTIYTSSGTNEYGNRIVVPFAGRVCGVALRGRIVDDARVALFSSTPALLASVDIDETLTNNPGASTQNWYFPLAAGVTVAAGDVLYLTLRAKTATANNCRLENFNNVAAGDLAYLPGGTSVYGASRAWTADGDAFAAIQDDRYCIVPVFDQLDDGAGGAGGGGVVRRIPRTVGA